MPEVTGATLKRALHSWDLRRKQAREMFDYARFAFEGEAKPPIEEVERDLMKAEIAYATVQDAQARLNQAVLVEVPEKLVPYTGGRTVVLASCIRLHGAAQRAKSRWEAYVAAFKEAGSIYRQGDDRVRTKDQIHARAAVTITEAQQRVLLYEEVVGLLSAAIAEGNAKPVLDSIDPGLIR